MKKIVVTGGSGAAGSFIIRHLLAQGYDVLNIDIMAPREEISPYLRIDLTDYAEVFTAMYGYDAAVHFGSNPNPDSDHLTGSERFKNNTLATYNVFQAAAALEMKRVVWASSETVLGFPFENVQPDYVPMDEAHRLMPQNSYALSKVVCEELARHMNILYGIPIIALRFSNIHYTGTAHPHNYEAVPSFHSEPYGRSVNLWGYIDARDAAEAVYLSLTADITTADAFIIAAADSIMDTPSADLMAAVFPHVPIKDGLGEYESLLCTNKAKRLLGWEPKYSWRNAQAPARLRA